MALAPDAKRTAGSDRSAQVRTLFSEIAPRYDVLNHVLSMNIDRRWRRKAIDRLGWQNCPEGTYLDGCAGTFDLSLELARRPEFSGRVVALDFAFPMLFQGLGKTAGTGIQAVCGDALCLPFEPGTFDGITIGFGVRNLSDLGLGFTECLRVLKDGGRLVVLEFTVPPSPLLRRAYMLYFNHILPKVGRLVSGHPWAYTYLPESVRDFPGPNGVAALLESAGFGTVSWSLLTGGIAAVHVGVKPPPQAP